MGRSRWGWRQGLLSLALLNVTAAACFKEGRVKDDSEQAASCEKRTA